MAQEKHESDDFEQDQITLRDNGRVDTVENYYSKAIFVDGITSFVKELRHNEVTRFSLILSICVAFAFSLQGWGRGQAGSAFLDIIQISGTDLEKGSAFTTAYFAGNMLGSVFGGALYSKVNKYLLLVTSMLVNNVTLAIIPWCSHYEVMLAVHAIHGICNGIMSVVLLAVAVSIWGATTRGRVYLNILFASFSAAGLISPLITYPFLLPTKTTTNVNSSDSTSITSDLTTDGFVGDANFSTSYDNITQTGKPTSNIFVAYSLTAGLGLISIMPFLYFILSKEDIKITVHHEVHFKRDLPIYIKVIQLVNVGIFSLFYTSLNFTLIGYLAAFCVHQLHWTKTSGAFVTSVYFLSMFTGRILGAFISHFFKPIKILFFSSLLYTVGLAGLSVSGTVFIDTGIWITVCVIGLALSLMWPSLMSWTNENLIAVRGKMMTYLTLTGFLGALLSPLLFGYMMEEISPIWFCFLSLCKAAVTIINVIFMFVFTQKFKDKTNASNKRQQKLDTKTSVNSRQC